MNKSAVILSLLALALIMCTYSAEDNSENSYFSDLVEIVPALGNIPERIALDQSWDHETRENFYFTSQGSRIIPYNWFVWLEQSDNTEYFRSAEHMESLRYLPAKSSPKNPGGLPIGFSITKDVKGKDRWIGLTCAACHTNQIDFNEHKILIDGAPTLANFNLFYGKIVASLSTTYHDTQKFNRFAHKILSSQYSKRRADKLKKVLKVILAKAEERQIVNSHSKALPDDFISYGRLEAFGEIQNAGTALAFNRPDNKNEPNAPVSYPYIWGTHQSDVAEYNASAENRTVIGPLLRNIGEVVGVFGNLHIEKIEDENGISNDSIIYTSSINIHNLGLLETMVKNLRAPSWESTTILPPIDEAAAKRGAILYKQTCSCCHQVVERKDEGLNYKAVKTPLSEVGTDKMMAWNAANNMASTFDLEGSKSGVIIGPQLDYKAKAMDIAINGIIGVTLSNPVTSMKASLMPLEDSIDQYAQKSLADYLLLHLKTKKETLENKSYNCTTIDTTNALHGLVYKARPLNGIWATAPFLHNGSVPNLWELLQRPEDRIEKFWVGSRELDPVQVGFQYNSGLNEFKVRNAEGELIPGNSNLGHVYGTRWSDDQKWDVIEYLKSL